MKVWVHLCAVASLIGLLGFAAPAHAIVPVVFGTSWDGPGHTLQDIVNARYGVGAINVQTDYIGAHPGDIDPWFWVGNFSALMVAAIAGNADYNVVGWYTETGSMPVLDGVHDGVLFQGPNLVGTHAFITFDQPKTKFGFYLIPMGPDGAGNPTHPQIYFTNRLFNDIGPYGQGALHAPTDGDVQALIFDVTRFVAGADGSQQVWLVCFEDLDSGAIPGPCCSPTDNDFNDAVFEVTAFGATPAAPVSFGALKERYRK